MTNSFIDKKPHRSFKVMLKSDAKGSLSSSSISFVYSRHVETVVRLFHKNADGFSSVKMDYEEGIDRLPERVTYSMIQEYIEQNYNFKVHTAYIDEVKRSLGLPMYVLEEARYGRVFKGLLERYFDK